MRRPVTGGTGILQGLHRRDEAGDARLQRVGRREPPGHVHPQEGSSLRRRRAASGPEPTFRARWSRPPRVRHVMTSAKFSYALPVACALIAFSSTQVHARHRRARQRRHAVESGTVAGRSATLEWRRRWRPVPSPSSIPACSTPGRPYDAQAVGTRLGGNCAARADERTDCEQDRGDQLRRPTGAGRPVSVGDAMTLFDPLLDELGYRPRHEASASVEGRRRSGIAAAEAVIAFRHHDGANQLGDLYPERSPVRGLHRIRAGERRADAADPNRWQPLLQTDGHAAAVPRAALGTASRRSR